LKAGETWKIGETLDYDHNTGVQYRYKKKILENLNLRFVPKRRGTKSQIYEFQQQQIDYYIQNFQMLPPGNKGRS
jgi:hypothetical protein